MDIKKLNTKKKLLKKSRLKLEESINPATTIKKNPNEPHPESVLGIVKEKAPSAYFNFRMLYKQTMEFYSEMQDASVITIRKANSDYHSRHDIKDAVDIWPKIDMILKKGDLAEYLAVLDLTMPDFQAETRNDPDMFEIIINNKADDIEISMVDSIKTISGADKNAKHRYVETGRILKEDVNKYFDEMSAKFDQVRNLEAALKSPEIRELLESEDRIIDIKNLLLGIALVNKARLYLSFMIWRGKAKEWTELKADIINKKGEIDTLVDEISDKKSEKEEAVKDLAATKNLIARAEKNRLDYVEMFKKVGQVKLVAALENPIKQNDEKGVTGIESEESKEKAENDPESQSVTNIVNKPLAYTVKKEGKWKGVRGIISSKPNPKTGMYIITLKGKTIANISKEERDRVAKAQVEQDEQL